VDDMEVLLNRGVTSSRWTFIIGKDGKIKYVNQQVDAENDSKAVLEALSVKYPAERYKSKQAVSN